MNRVPDVTFKTRVRNDAASPVSVKLSTMMDWLPTTPTWPRPINKPSNTTGTPSIQNKPSRTGITSALPV